MAIRQNGIETYKGQVVSEKEHMWMDGMLEITAFVWNMEDHRMESKQVGYIGADGSNLCDCSWEIDLSRDAERDIIRTRKQEAYRAYAKSVVDEKNRIRAGRDVEVVRVRKVKRGTRLHCFLVGERPTYMSQLHSYLRETEEIAGCKDDEGNKFWIKSKYLKNITELKSPDAKNRKKFIRNYLENECGSMVIEKAAE